MKVSDFTIRSNTRLNDRNYLLKVTPAGNEPLPEMYPGQFVQIRVDNSTQVFLRRPISINYVDHQQNEIWLLIQSVGEGTAKISALSAGETMNLLFPLGSSFSLPDEKGNFLLIGGGVGTAPLLFLGKKMREKGLEPEFLLGGRSEKDILQRDDSNAWERSIAHRRWIAGRKWICHPTHDSSKKKYDLYLPAGLNQ